jgi:hypothetical protein
MGNRATKDASEKRQLMQSAATLYEEWLVAVANCGPEGVALPTPVSEALQGLFATMIRLSPERMGEARFKAGARKRER